MATWAAFSAMQAGSEPRNCTRTGTPDRVRPRLRSSGTTRWNRSAGNNVLVMRMNSVTQASMPLPVAPPGCVRVSRSR